MDPRCADALLDALAARRGVIAAVGAGGKKTTLYRLAEAHLAIGTPRIALTCTVTMGLPPAGLGDEALVAEADVLALEVPVRAPDCQLLTFAEPSAKPGRVGGLPLELLPGLHRRGGFDVMLIKADGARMRWIKAPADREPVLPEGVTTLLPIVSAKALGRPLEASIGHRLERLTVVIEAALGEPLGPPHLARLLTSERGALQRAGTATVVPIINMVEDDATLAGAREAARLALRASDRFDRVVLAAMAAAQPIVEVVSR